MAGLATYKSRDSIRL